jgi:hypothetical protein
VTSPESLSVSVSPSSSESGSLSAGNKRKLWSESYSESDEKQIPSTLERVNH